MTVIDEADDLTAPEVYNDPYSYFGHLRETDPVHWNAVFGTWVVTRYSDVAWLIRNHELFSSSPQPVDPSAVHPPLEQRDWEAVKSLQQIVPNLLSNDRPQHAAMRRAVHRWFTPKAVEIWRATLRGTVQELIDAHRLDGGMDIKHDFATALPLRTICLMLGVPGSDAPRLRELSDDYANASSVVSVGFEAQRVRGALRAHAELYDYFSPLIAGRKRQPGDDLLSVVASAQRAGVFTHDECVENAIVFLGAGHETTLNAITNGVLAFLRNPEQWLALREDPPGNCVPATEECLRYEPSIQTLVRFSGEAVVLGGRTIDAGDRVHWVMSAANRDPREFPDPDTFDIRREPNRHLAFGGGIHHCLGAALARIEIQEALRGLAERFPRIYLSDEALEYLPSLQFRSLRALRVAW